MDTWIWSFWDSFQAWITLTDISLSEHHIILSLVARATPCSWAHWECAGLGKESVFKSRDHWAFLFDRTFHRRSQRSQTLLCSEITRTDALRFWMHMWLFMYWAGPKHCPHLLQQFIHLKGSNMTNDVNFVTNILCLKQLWRTTSLVTLQRSLH